MSILKDANGTYNLSAVVAVTPGHMHRKTATNEVAAVLHFAGGLTVVAATAYDAFVALIDPPAAPAAQPVAPAAKTE